jgi:LL-diaminopimelate aminotransferase
MKRNPNMARLKANYLFPEINLRKKEFLARHPEASLVSLGIGDTTEPLPQLIAESLAQKAKELGTISGYSGYGPEQGVKDLREKIAEKIYEGRVIPDEVFISDGAKCDLGRLQMLFGPHVSILVQDPSYPVYIDGSLIAGVENIFSMRCVPENRFFPDLSVLPRADLIYFCSPNNPTGVVANKQQLEDLVNFAKKNHSIIIFDSAYANYIQDSSLPRSIFEIEGARNVAIEISSFSKLVGFTGVRLGWTVIPSELQYDDGSPVKADWNRLMSTLFNGASNISQIGGCSVLEEAGLKEVSALTQFYMENASMIKRTLEKIGYEVYGGSNAPYLWVRFRGKKSWDVFQDFLERIHLVTTPGLGFGPAGEEFVRMTAFGHRETILEAIKRLEASNSES